MTSIRARSRTGCLTCRNRRKKCDEIRPYCQRCKRAGMECLGYSHLSNPVPVLRDPTTISDTSAPLRSQSHAKPVHNSNDIVEDYSLSLEEPVWTDIPDFLLPLPTENVWFPSPNNPQEESSSINLLGYDTGSYFASTIPVPTYSGYFEFVHQPASGLDLNLGSASQSFGTYDTTLPAAQSSVAHALEHTFNQNFEEFDRSQKLIRPDYYRVAPPIVSHGTLPHQNDSSSTTNDDSDTEGVLDSIQPTLALDRSVENNFLPYALSSYLRWTIRTVFEPLRTVQSKRDHVIQRYMQSEESRSATIFIANILDAIMKDPSLAVSNFPALVELENRVHWKMEELKFRQNQPRNVRISYAQDVLYDMHKLLHIRGLSATLSYRVNILKKAVFAYQEACHESTTEPFALTARLLHPNSLLRHFHVLDVMLSLGTGHPTILRYDLTPVDKIQHSLVDSERLQWMHGLPDRLFLLLARMHALREESVPNIDPRTIGEIESEILGFKPTFDNSADSYLTIARMMVQECWRQVLYIYLYMGLCGGDTSDARVKKALKGFIKLLRGVNAGRNPDCFLIIPLIVGGVAARQQCDRDLIQNRLLGLRECSQSNITTGDNAIRMLGELWSTSNLEARPSAWGDLGMAYSRATGTM